MSGIAERYWRLRERIARAAQQAGRSPDEIQLVVVSKTVGPERIREAWEAGHRCFGENRAQEFSSKLQALSDLAIEWHFIGHLQKNKVRLVVPASALIHSIDSPELASKIDRRAGENAPQSILVQVNTTGERSKSGVPPEALAPLLDRIAELPNLQVDGLMTIGPFTDEEKPIRAAFRNLRETLNAQRREQRPQAPLRHLSMGMSADLEIAIEEGATIVRVGTAVFGTR